MMNMKGLKKVIRGLAATTLLLTGFALSHAQTPDWPQYKAQPSGIGRNGAPNTSGPGRAFLTWWRPNLNDNLGATEIVDNEAPTGIVFNPAAQWLAPATRADEAFFAYQPDPNSAQPYRYAHTVASDTGDDPTIPAPAQPLRTATWTFNNLGVTPRNVALYMWLPAGPTVEGGVLVYPQRFFVYEILYGNGQRWIDVVDTTIAGTGWFRLGNGGRDTNMMFPYNGTTPIQVRLYNTVPRRTDGSLSDTPIATTVYADAAMAVPEIGYYSSSPIISQHGALPLLQTSVFAALNERTVATVNGEPTTVERGALQAFEHDTGARKWTFRPALEDPDLAASFDNNSAGVTSAPPWTVGNAAIGYQGTNYLFAPLVNNPLGGSNVRYNPDQALNDGEYDIYIFLPTAASPLHPAGFGQSVMYEVHEGPNVTQLTVDQSGAGGWVRLGNRSFTHSAANRLEVIATNVSLNPADVGKEAYSDAVKFVGPNNVAIHSTPVYANALITPQGGGAPVARDVVVTAAENGRIYCLDAAGNGAGEPIVLWTYPSTRNPNDPNWSDPNQVVGEDGPGGIAQMPTSGFDISSALIQRINGEDFLFIAARNGRVYCIEMKGRGDMNVDSRIPGTTRRSWTYPNDYPATPVQSQLGNFIGSLTFAVTASGPTIFAPASQGRMYALDAVGNGNKTTNVRWRYPAANQRTLGTIQTTPAIEFGNIYFGTDPLDSDQEPRGAFYALNVDNGNLVWRFDGAPATGSLKVADQFLGGPVTVPGATLGGGMPDTVFVANENRIIYALNAQTGAIVWQTDELAVGVIAPLSYTSMFVMNQLGGFNLLPDPVILVPTSDGRLMALYARLTDLNRFGGRLAYGFETAGDRLIGNAAVGRDWMYLGDNKGYLYAFSNNATPIGGQGPPPPGANEIIPPNDASADVFRNAKIAFVRRPFYNRLRLQDVPTADPNLPTYAEAINPANWELDDAFEWGETIYIMVYDFPYATQDTNGATVEPPQVNFSFSVEGTAIRNISQRSKLFRLSTPDTPNSGYAILAFPLQGGGTNAMPPGSGTISFTISTSSLNSNGSSQTISMDPTRSQKSFRVANPIGLEVFDLNNIAHGIGVTALSSDPGALANGSPDISTTVTREDLLTTSYGFLSHGQASKAYVNVYDRSLMTLLRGPGRGLENLRAQRRDLEWQGGAGRVVKPIDSVLYPLFEELPVNYPNTSPDYPNIARENVKITKDPNGDPENPLYGPTSLIAPTGPGGVPVDENNKDNRVLVPTPFELELQIPRYQPPNNATVLDADAVSMVPGGYYGRVYVFVDSSGNGILDRMNGRREANRFWWLGSGVSIDQKVQINTPTIDMGALAPGTGYTPVQPGLAGSTFAPWPNDNSNPYRTLFKSFQMVNEGNVNMLNLRLAKGSKFNGNLTPWEIPAAANEETAWFDASRHVWTDFDYNNGFHLTTPFNILPKPRVGDRSGTEYTTNPIRRENANTGAVQGPLLPNISPAAPRIGVTVPVGMPVGTYMQLMYVIEDGVNGDGSLNSSETDSLVLLGPNREPREPYTDPTLTLIFKVREGRMTNSFSGLSYPMIDNLIPGGSTPPFLHRNSQPTAFRDANGQMFVAWTSNREFRNAPQPTDAVLNDQYRVYMAAMKGSYNSNLQSPLENLNNFARSAGDPAFFEPGPGPYPVAQNPSAGALAPLFPTATGETLIPETARFGGASVAAGGVTAPFGGPGIRSLFMVFNGEVQKQLASGERIVSSHLYIVGVTINSSGVINLDRRTPTRLDSDPQAIKSRASVVQSGASAVAFYTQSGTGASQIYWNQFQGNFWGSTNTVPIGDGFESVSSPMVYGRMYQGANGPRPVLEFTFVGKLRSKQNSEVFFGRMNCAASAVPQGAPVFLGQTTEALTLGTAGTYQAQGVSWNPRANAGGPGGYSVRLQQVLNGVTSDLIVAGSERRDSQTGLYTYDTSLGGKVYIDPSMGTVRFGTATPNRSATLLLTYTPRYVRVSNPNSASHSGASVVFDNRIDSFYRDAFGNYSTNYWARPGNVSIDPNTDAPRSARYIFSYTRGAAGEGLTTRPYLKTLRFGVELGNVIFTNPDGSLPGGSLTITGNTSFYQVDPAHGHIYFTDADEDRVINVTYTPTLTNGQQGAPITLNGLRVGMILERAESPMPIDQAVNESQLFVTADSWDAAAVGQRMPHLLWMFWTSTRAGGPDLYFQTMAPRFTPVARRN
jgi:hypothetical protein